MRLVISVLMIGHLMACVRHPAGDEHFEKAQYRPLPHVEVSTFTAKGHIVSAYVRHSGDAVLFRLSSENPDDVRAVSVCAPKSVMRLSVSDQINFSSNRYESFDQSYDMFKDGTIVLVPLAEDNVTAVGVFVNLISGKRYFFMPSMSPDQLLAKVPSLAKRWRGIKIVTPEDVRSAQELARFPEFEE